MDISRIGYLRKELEYETISSEELLEIEEAFDKIPDDELREDRENALASDMLDELARRVSPIEKAIYDYIYDIYGESEANDPAYDISGLANRLNAIPVNIGNEIKRLGEVVK